MAALCLVPATAGAEVSDFGSDLAAPADLSANHGADTSYWNVAPSSALGGYPAPAGGQVTVVQVKGGLIPNPRLRNTEAEQLAQIIHFQVLRDKGDGRFKIVQLSTGHLEIPLDATPQDRVTTYRPVNLCVKKGDLVAFNTIGAYEYRSDPGQPGGANGAEYQVFGRVPDQVTQWYEKDNGLNEGASILPSPNEQMLGHELLMKTTLATGPDATDLCPGGYAQHVFRGLEFKKHPQPSVRTKTRHARLRVFCHGENYGGCTGTMKLEATLNGVPAALGAARFHVPGSHTEMVEIPLSPDTLLKIQQAGRVKATATADAHDNPRSDARVKWDSVPVQQKTTSDRVVLTPDKKPCIVPKKLIGKSSRVAKAAIRKAGCKAVVKFKKTAETKQAGKVVAVSPAPSSVLPAGSKVTITVAKRK